MPDALNTERDEIDETEWESIQTEINSTLDKIQAYRLEEGKALENDFVLRISNIDNLDDFNKAKKLLKGKMKKLKK